jgi:hypothetical protein
MMLAGLKAVRSKLGGWPFYWLVVSALVLTLTGVVLIARSSASASGVECEFGAISAIGPLDARGKGDTTPKVRCIP